jgi:hypothetical protein
MKEHAQEVPKPPSRFVFDFGSGTKNPRFRRVDGALMLLIGAGLAWALYAFPVIPVRAIFVAPVFVLYGGWFTLLGGPANSERPAWVDVGGWICGLVGIAIGIAIAFAI